MGSGFYMSKYSTNNATANKLRYEVAEGRKQFKWTKSSSDEGPTATSSENNKHTTLPRYNFHGKPLVHVDDIHSTTSQTFCIVLHTKHVAFSLPDPLF